MSDELMDPTKPPRALVETREDGSALRNDGVDLKSARQNPWYVLATVYGEQTVGGIDWDKHLKNRRIWNGWACAALDEAARQALAEKLKLPVEDLAPLAAHEEELVDKAYAERLPKGTQVPDVQDLVDFRETHFSNSVGFERCVFSGYAWFDSATFSGHARFQSTSFGGGASFEFATFSRHAWFESATFSGPAWFQSATFSDLAWFGSATFSGGVSFWSATFGGDADFSDGAFAAETDFENVQFETKVPQFYQRDLHQHTVFTTEDENWPKITADNAKAGKQAYTRLRQLMNGLEKPDDEHFFFRQEMRCKAYTEEGLSAWLVWLYGFVSDYGHSVSRPLAALGFLFLLGVAANWGYFTSGVALPEGVADSRLGSAFGLSFGSLFGFLGINRLFFSDLLRELPDVLKALSGFQTVFGFILLFFLGLGLRNHFRLK